MSTTIIMMVVVTMVLVLIVIKHIYSWKYCLLKKNLQKKNQTNKETKPNFYSLSSILTELAHVGTSWVCIRY